ncbi:MAG: hypothetical protein WC508_05525 [Patescibacteria group bacterium]
MENKKIKNFIIILEIVIAIIFVFTSKISDLVIKTFHDRYFADIVIPFSFYFLLILNGKTFPQLKPWFVKAILVFLLCALSETLQYFGIYALASVFDPIDYVMYGVGVILAALVDRQLFKRLVSFWE